jgi:cbb3-type cytochrome oxidase subunit 3
MIVIGGYVGTELSCDSPGIYVFNTTSLDWETEFTAVSSSSEAVSSNLVQPGGVYQVPQVVVQVVGGGNNGGATVTRPVHSADPDSPVATAAPDDYKFTTFTTITNAAATPTTRITTDANGHTQTIVSTPTAAGKTNGGSGGSSSSPNIGAIVGGVLGGIIFLVLCLFGAAYWIYRRKIAELRASAAALAEENAQMNGRNSKEGAPVNDRNGDLRRSDSVTDLLDGEPTFWGVLLSPRRSLRVVNH